MTELIDIGNGLMVDPVTGQMVNYGQIETPAPIVSEYAPTDWNTHLGIKPVAGDLDSRVPTGWDMGGRMTFTNEDLPPPVPKWGGLPATAASTQEELLNAKAMEIKLNQERDAAIRWLGQQDYSRFFDDAIKNGANVQDASMLAFTKAAPKMFKNDPAGFVKSMTAIRQPTRQNQNVIRTVGNSIFSINPSTGESQEIVKGGDLGLGSTRIVNDPISGKPLYVATQTGPKSIHLEKIEKEEPKTIITKEYMVDGNKVVIRASQKAIDEFDAEFKAKEDKRTADEAKAKEAAQSGGILDWVSGLFGGGKKQSIGNTIAPMPPNSASGPSDNLAVTNTPAVSAPRVNAPVPVPPPSAVAPRTSDIPYQYPDFGPEKNQAPNIPYQYPDFGPIKPIVPVPFVPASVTNAQGMPVPAGLTNSVGLTPQQLRKLNATTNVLDKSEIPVIKTKAEYDALPPGTIYIGTNGKRFKKL